MTLWEIDIYPDDGQPDLESERITAEAEDMQFDHGLSVRSAHGYLLDGDIAKADVEQLATELLSDPVVETTVAASVGSVELEAAPSAPDARLVHVLPKPGVMDPVAQSALAAIKANGFPVDAVRTLKKYWITGLTNDRLSALCKKILANDSIEQVVVGPLTIDRLDVGSPYTFRRQDIAIRDMSDDRLMKLSHDGQLYLTIAEMRTIQSHFRQLDREPSDVELETIAQTWSEHCSHKTLAGRIAYRDENGQRGFDNMLKETIFAATERIREELGDEDWCVSVFEDNAGIVRFDEQNNVVFKVETHNHPSAIEPYGGANTGIGGVIRDPLGTGLGAKPVCNTDVFCFAPPDTAGDEVPPGVLHPRRVMKGVVAGVRDYGNRMGIPTVNGAIYFDRRYLGNPLVYCGNVGIIPRDKCRKEARADDYIVAIGGRTGRDGIHGATFSSAELTSESETVSGGAVQIGNAVTEKMVLDVLLVARDRQLYNAVTDCGAGGFSSAVGEMGQRIGAEVWLERAPLKYEGLSYTEIWISEAQERMVLSVPPDNWEEFSELCLSENVEATILGKFEPTGHLRLKYHGQQVADLSMTFLHDGRPPVVRDATYHPAAPVPLNPLPAKRPADRTEDLLKILRSLNVASKEWVIRQYDHEVQGGSVVKPLVGIRNDGPSDAAVVRPDIRSRRGLTISCGMNPYYGDFDTYHMAASAIDEAVRNGVAVGANPNRIALLDNFCWGYTDRAETLGSLVRAALACHDLSVALRMPFISGKDSLNNEFSFVDSQGQKQMIAIPPSLLISAMGQVDDVRQCVTMDLKQPGNHVFIVGMTHDELGGSHWALTNGVRGGNVPRVDPALAAATFQRLHTAIKRGLVRSCHDLSEGGLAVALAEMAFAGEVGMQISLDRLPHTVDSPALEVPLLFSESNTRFLCEVEPQRVDEFREAMADVPHRSIGETMESKSLRILGCANQPKAENTQSNHNERARVKDFLVDCELSELKENWQAPLRW